MTIILVVCNYCGHKYSLNPDVVEILKDNLFCTHCNDKDVKLLRKEDHIIDTYAGSPPFEAPKFPTKAVEKHLRDQLSKTEESKKEESEPDNYVDPFDFYFSGDF